MDGVTTSFIGRTRCLTRQRHASRSTPSFATSLTGSPTQARTLTKSLFDNHRNIDAMTGAFFTTLETECEHGRAWPTRQRAKLEVGPWIKNRHNRRRRHSALAKSPRQTSQCNTQTRRQISIKPRNSKSTSRGRGQPGRGCSRPTGASRWMCATI